MALSISVVIPTCDRHDYLLKAIECVLAQSRPADEIIVVNNGAAHLPAGMLPDSITVLELSPYVGVARARNQGVDLAMGDYVAFLDDDDLWESEYLQKVSVEIEAKQPDCLVTRLDKLFDGTIFPYKNAAGKLNLPNLFVMNPGVGGQTTVVRRTAFIELSGYDLALPPSEDKSLIIDLLLEGRSVIAAPHIQAILRIHQGPRLTDANSIQKGTSEFLKKYGVLMSFAQRNFNMTKIYYYRYLNRPNRADYYNYLFHFGFNVFFRTFDKAIPAAPRLS